MEGDALRGLRADAGKPAELVDQRLDGRGMVAAKAPALVDQLGTGERLRQPLERPPVVFGPGIDQLGRIDGLLGAGFRVGGLCGR